jgi:hypothetical protein
MEGALVADDVHADLLGEVQRLAFEDVAVEDEILHIGLLPCAACPGGGNIDVILNAIEILPEGSAKPQLHRGDADQNLALELTDAIQVLGYLFLGSTTRVPECEDAADADDNGVIELTDAIRILGYLFLGTGEIPAPGPTENPCGEDPTPEDPALGCLSYDPASCQ